MSGPMDGAGREPEALTTYGPRAEAMILRSAAAILERRARAGWPRRVVSALAVRLLRGVADSTVPPG